MAINGSMSTDTIQCICASTISPTPSSPAYTKILQQEDPINELQLLLAEVLHMVRIPLKDAHFTKATSNVVATLIFALVSAGVKVLLMR